MPWRDRLVRVGRDALIIVIAIGLGLVVYFMLEGRREQAEINTTQTAAIAQLTTKLQEVCAEANNNSLPRDVREDCKRVEEGELPENVEKILQGPPGEPGLTVIGPPGKPGRDASYQQISIAIMDYCTASPGRCKGADGKSVTGPKGDSIKGEPGESIKGDPGESIQGPPGQNATDAQVAAAVAAYCGQESQPCKGEKGDTGEKGSTGEQGEQGAQGRPPATFTFDSNGLLPGGNVTCNRQEDDSYVCE